MPNILSVATAVPDHRIEQEFAREFAGDLFSGRIEGLDRLLPVFANAGVATRHVVAPPDWYGRPHDLAERSELYVRAATELSTRAAREALARADLTPSDVDTILYVNTTGLATPSIDARLAGTLGLRPDVRRLPVWGLGCAGGAAGLAHAHHLACGAPRGRILLVATELCSLTFMPDDPSRSNLVAAALFADGAAAAVVAGDDVQGDGVGILGTRSRLYPDSLDVMGWTVLQQGFQVVFARRIPDIVRKNAREDLSGFVADHGFSLRDIDAFLLHPGGAKVIEAYEQALDLAPDALANTRAVLRDHGNMSSATVLFVLERQLADREAARGGRGLLSALGPGFSSETLLLAL